MVLQSRNAVQLAFLDDPLVRLMGALYAVLVVVALSRQKLDHLVDVICATATEWSRSKTYRLTYFEFAISHRALHCAPLVGGTRQLQLSALGELYYHEIASWGFQWWDGVRQWSL
jgi:hypothetical protein